MNSETMNGTFKLKADLWSGSSWPATLLVAVLLHGLARSPAPAAGPSDRVIDPRWGDLPQTKTAFLPPRYETLGEWRQRREHLRKQILWAAGLWPLPEKTPLNAHIFGRIEHDEYTVEKVYFESIPGLFVTGNLYRPRRTSPRSHPGVLNPHGHAATGRLHDDKIASYQARCITFARMGCVAFMWDMIDYNDSAMQLQGHYQEKTYWNVHNAPWKPERGRRALWNVNALGIQLWNSIRALDFLASLPDVDPERLACTGESGGGTQTFLLAAVDDRVKVAAPVCMVSSYMQGGCNCENAPGLRIGTHNTEFAYIAAPRPMMLVSVTKDWTRHTPEVEFPAIKRIYQLYGAQDKLAHAHFDAQHGYNLDMRNAVYPWMAKWLSLKIPKDFHEPPYSGEKRDDLLVFNKSVPEGAIRDHETLVNRLIESAQQRLQRYRPVTAEKLAQDRRFFGEGLRLSIGVTPFRANEVSYAKEGEFDLAGIKGQHGILIGTRRGVRIPIWVFPPDRPSKSSACALLVHGQGRAALAAKRDLLQGLLEDGQTVYAIEPFGIGDARPKEDLAKQRGSTQYFMTFNRTDDAERVYDIVAAIGYSQWHGIGGQASKQVNVAGFGKAGPWLAVAGAILGTSKPPQPMIRFALDANRFEGTREKAYLEDLFIPGILRAGGLPNALAMIAPWATLLHNTGDRLDTSTFKAARAIVQTGAVPAETKIDSAACSEASLLAFMTRAPSATLETIRLRSAETGESDAPYPPSTLVKGISFGERIIDGVTSGDQWAATWADDGHLYSAWGDGTGFGHRGGWNDRWTTYLGVPRLEGHPPAFHGYNVWGGYEPESRTPAFYRNRDLNENLKPNSSLVCIDGVLYLYAVRKKAGTHGEWSLNRLLTSDNHARNWTDHGVLFDEPKGRFANVFTIQYGQDYSGLPSFQGDEVYFYGLENKDQTLNKDILLARCDKHELKERKAYEFFAGTPEKPSWTRDLSQAKSIFHADGGVSWWASCTYNEPLGRYLLLTTHPPFAGRFRDHQGFGLFESARPWGPWRTIVSTQHVGNIIPGMTEGISFSIPSPWIFDAGKSMWMIFAGRPSEPFYSFNLIKLNLELTSEARADR